MTHNFVYGVAIGIVALAAAALVAVGSFGGSYSGAQQIPECDPSDLACERDRTTAIAHQTELAEVELTARQGAWSAAGATLVAERDYLFGEIQTANARLDDAFMPLQCYEFQVGDFEYEYRYHAEAQPGYSDADLAGLDYVFTRVAGNCMANSAAAMHRIIAPTATVIAALTATALAEAE